MSSDIDVYQPAAIEPYRGALAMTPEAAKALDEQVRRCTEAVLREGTDFGVIPGTGGEKSLWRPGAQKLLQWFGLGFTCERVEVERDDDGRKHGITYRCTVGRRLPDGSIDVKATCEGTADYDESKFYKSAEQVQRDAETKERKWAEQYKRAPRPTYWQGLPEYRAPWNSLMKRAQKRAIVGAVVDATAAGGIFSEREEDDTPVADDGSTWYEQALERAFTFTAAADGSKLITEAAEAVLAGLCAPRQSTHVQNRAKARMRLLAAARPVDVEDLGRQDAAPGPDDAPEFGTERHAKLVGVVWRHLQRLGYPAKVEETDEQKLERLVTIARLAGVSEIGSTSDLDLGELSRVADALARCKDRAALDALLEAGETGG